MIYVCSLVDRCDVLTAEIEHVDVETMEMLEQPGVDCQPKASTIRIIQVCFFFFFDRYKKSCIKKKATVCIKYAHKMTKNYIGVLKAKSKFKETIIQECFILSFRKYEKYGFISFTHAPSGS